MMMNINNKLALIIINFTFVHLLFGFQRVLLQRVLPCLTSEFANPDMVPFVLPSVMIIAENCTKEQFQKDVFPPLIPVFKLQTPVQVSYFS